MCDVLNQNNNKDGERQGCVAVVSKTE